MMKRENVKVSDVLAMFGKDRENILDVIGAKEVVMSSHGEILSVDGKKLVTGPKKKSGGRGKRAEDGNKLDLLEAATQTLRTATAFVGKVHPVSSISNVVRMADADYVVSITAHAKAEFADRAENFVAERTAPRTPKNAVNHSAAITNFLVAQVQNSFSKSNFKFENQISITLLEQKGAVIRFEFSDGLKVAEYSFKVTKKKERVVTLV